MGFFSRVRIVILGVVLTAPPAFCASPGILVIPGTGESQELLRVLSPSFSRQYPDFRLGVPESIGSRGGINALRTGRANVARSARPLKPEEKAAGLVEHLFAASPVVLVVHPSVTGVESLSGEQLHAIFSGRITRWSEVGGPDAKIYLVDRDASDSTRKVLGEHLPWLGEIASVGKVFYTSPNAAQAIAGHRFTLGYLSLSMANAYGVRQLAVDGARPDAEAILSGAYPYVVPLYLVTLGKHSGAVSALLRFLSSEEAKALIRREGLIPSE